MITAGLAVNDASQGLENLSPTGSDVDARLQLLSRSERRFAQRFPLPAVRAKQAAFNKAIRLMQSKRSQAFDLDQEPDYIRKEYGDHRFGQSCLLARRLVETGVSFVEVVHRGWDDHEGAAKPTAQRAPWIDAGTSALIRDLKARGMLDDTLVVWTTEFGRTPYHEKADHPGREHHHQVFSSWLAGGGVKSGIVYGSSDEHGIAVAEDRVHVHDFHATILHLLGLNHERLTFRHAGRDYRLTDVHGQVIREILV